jgi:hypothetical protein
VRTPSFFALFLLSLAIGALTLWICTQPTWEHSGIACVIMFPSAALLGFLAPSRAWIFAFAVSAWVAVAGLAHGNPPALFALVIGLGGAYVGAFARRLLASIVP